MAKFPIETIRHSAAHVMAAAVQKLFGDVKFDIGPSTSDGFYYDFDMEHRLSVEDLEKIEEEMRKIVNAHLPFEYSEMSREEAKAMLEGKNQPYKLERLADIEEGSKITFYTDGVRYNTVSDDAQVIEATRYLLERWQYSGDTLSVSLYCEPQLTEEELAAMNYDSIYLSKYSKLVYMTIKMERFDLEAVRDLSLLPQVTSIHIGPHMLAYSLG